MEKKLSIISHKKAKSLVEKTRDDFSWLCYYLCFSSCYYYRIYDYFREPAIFKEGITGILFSTTWAPQQRILNMGLLMLY